MRRCPFLTFIVISAFLTLSACQHQKKQATEPYGAIPTERQLQWHTLEYYGFLHFGLNTFTGQEWGYGDVSPEVFDPVGFDADQIVATAKDAGMKGLILTCKHHDGFCLWPSAFTGYSVKNAPWKDGKGDVVKEISEACEKHGLKFGVYLSPWDRHHKDYGKPEYIVYYRNQLRELLTNYGPVFEVWFDGANGGDGWYGGADEERIIDRSTYYDWENTFALVRELQPGAVIFSDVGPDVRWVGNETGFAGDPCWATYTPIAADSSTPAPGHVEYKLGQNGTRNGKYWIPAECDVSVRPRWFYNELDDERVKSNEQLMELWFQSVGRGASLLLNVPPDKQGRIAETDSLSLIKFKQQRDDLFGSNLATKAKVEASCNYDESLTYASVNLLDEKPETFWLAGMDCKHPEIVLQFKEPLAVNVISLQEYLPLGQRVEDWVIDFKIDGNWREVAQGKSIGSQRLVRLEEMKTQAIRIRFENCPVSPAISGVGVYN